jgi:selenocysteine lyase/cysteine desulfurase
MEDAMNSLDPTAGLSPELLEEVRARFAHVANCPFEGERIFFENAGGALTLNSVVETSARMAAIPDNQGRDNPASRALVAIIDKAKADMSVFFNAPDGRFFVGESGTELLFRLISVACLGSGKGGQVLGSTLEHPASRSAAHRWAEVSGKTHILVTHGGETGSVDPSHYLTALTPDTRVATIVHTSPVTGMGVDVAGISRAIRSKAPDCYIIVDGIQHAAHGRLDIASYGIDGYVISPYKVFSRHGYGVAWVSDRLAKLPHDHIIDAPGEPWDLGTRDTGAYATFSDVVGYFEWLGSKVSPNTNRRARIVAAGEAIHAHEKRLCEAMLHGTGNVAGLAEIGGIRIIGGIDNPRREGLVSFAMDRLGAPEVVEELQERGIRVHTRKADHYSGNVLVPLGLSSCVRVSLCHYNSEAEVTKFLHAMHEISSGV